MREIKLKKGDIKMKRVDAGRGITLEEYIKSANKNFSIFEQIVNNANKHSQIIKTPVKIIRIFHQDGCVNIDFEDANGNNFTQKLRGELAEKLYDNIQDSIKDADFDHFSWRDVYRLNGVELPDEIEEIGFCSLPHCSDCKYYEICGRISEMRFVRGDESE